VISRAPANFSRTVSNTTNPSSSSPLEPERSPASRNSTPASPAGALARILILNDLFVTPSARRQGTGAALLHAAAIYARQVRAIRLVLSTELTNTTAQRLYEKLGWQRNSGFCTYQLAL
jgi:GNAT superfamily N-acetyltransferase